MVHSKRSNLTSDLEIRLSMGSLTTTTVITPMEGNSYQTLEISWIKWWMACKVYSLTYKWTSQETLSLLVWMDNKIHISNSVVLLIIETTMGITTIHIQHSNNSTKTRMENHRNSIIKMTMVRKMKRLNFHQRRFEQSSIRTQPSSVRRWRMRMGIRRTALSV